MNILNANYYIIYSSFYLNSSRNFVYSIGIKFSLCYQDIQNDIVSTDNDRNLKADPEIFHFPVAAVKWVGAKG